MIVLSPTSLPKVVLTVLLLATASVQAEHRFSLTQGYDQGPTTNPQGTSAKNIMRQQLEDMLFGQSLDEYFSYQLGVNRSTGVKVHSSVGLKIRSDETLLQLRMRF